ncbi:MAG: TolC family protein [Methylophilaceae bacterium]
MACCLFSACATEKYEAKPLSVEKTTSKILAKDPMSEDFKHYLIKQNYKASELPFSTWGLDELTLCALYFHPKLDVTKAQLGLVNAQIQSAGRKQNLTLNGNLAHSDLANGDKRPWAYGLNVEIPIETSKKREIRIEEAEATAAVSLMDIADTAWQLRSEISKILIALEQNLANIQLLQTQLTTQTEISNMLQKRVDNGLASKTELSVVRLAQLKTQSEMNSAQAQSAEIRAILASDTGLTLDKFNQITLKPFDIDATIAQQAAYLDASSINKSLQETALLNRIDVRRSLAKYAAAESKIKQEIAKQTPDISLSPGIAFEYGDSIWSLGFSTLLGLTNKNQTQIAEAKQLREIEGAQFEALQSQIIGDLNHAYANFAANKAKLDQAQNLNASQMNHFKILQKQFNAGLIDRLALKQATLANILLQQQVLDAKFDLLKAASAIEDVMQHPIYAKFEMPYVITPN